MGNSTDNIHHVEEVKKRQQAESDLTDSNQIMSLIVDAIEDYAIFVLSPNGTILTWNIGAERLNGYRACEVIGQNFSIFYTPEDIARKHPQHELQVARQTGKYLEEGWRLRKDGSMFWANVTITAMFADTPTEGRVLRGFAKVTRDLTERKQAEDALRLAYSDLEARVEQRTSELAEAKLRAERAVASRDQFFSMASHELKTPLSALKLQAQLRRRSVLMGDFSDFAPENLLQLCDDDERQIDRLVYLVENMLDISKVTSGAVELKLQDVRLSAIFSEVIKVMEKTLLDAQNTWTIQCANYIQGQWDPTRIEQIFTNLLTNCAKYAPGSPIEITAVDEGETVKVHVRDRGPGIPLEKQNKIFNPFERLNATEVTGLGLGLYIIKQIAEAHKGSVAVKSAQDQGTIFTICLPVTPSVENHC